MYLHEKRSYDLMNDARKRIAPFEIKLAQYTFGWFENQGDSNLCMDHMRSEMHFLALEFHPFTLKKISRADLEAEFFMNECDECRGEADVLLRETKFETTHVEITEQSQADMHDEFILHVCENGVETA